MPTAKPTSLTPKRAKMDLVIHSKDGQPVGIFENLGFKRAIGLLYHINLNGYDDYKPNEIVCVFAPQGEG
jgi:hypothetical protein